MIVSGSVSSTALRHALIAACLPTRRGYADQNSSNRSGVELVRPRLDVPWRGTTGGVSPLGDAGTGRDGSGRVERTPPVTPSGAPSGSPGSVPWGLGSLSWAFPDFAALAFAFFSASFRRRSRTSERVGFRP